MNQNNISTISLDQSSTNNLIVYLTRLATSSNANNDRFKNFPLSRVEINSVSRAHDNPDRICIQATAIYTIPESCCATTSELPRMVGIAVQRAKLLSHGIAVPE